MHIHVDASAVSPVCPPRASSGTKSSPTRAGNSSPGEVLQQAHPAPGSASTGAGAGAGAQHEEPAAETARDEDEDVARGAEGAAEHDGVSLAQRLAVAHLEDGGQAQLLHVCIDEDREHDVEECQVHQTSE